MERGVRTMFRTSPTRGYEGSPSCPEGARTETLDPARGLVDMVSDKAVLGTQQAGQQWGLERNNRGKDDPN